eukprot:1158926-Pelagomonas_calceolata.AAC.1
MKFPVNAASVLMLSLACTHTHTCTHTYARTRTHIHIHIHHVRPPTPGEAAGAGAAGQGAAQPTAPVGQRAHHLYAVPAPAAVHHASAQLHHQRCRGLPAGHQAACGCHGAGGHAAAVDDVYDHDVDDHDVDYQSAGACHGADGHDAGVDDVYDHDVDVGHQAAGGCKGASGHDVDDFGVVHQGAGGHGADTEVGTGFFNCWQVDARMQVFLIARVEGTVIWGSAMAATRDT